jgi:hypothetical protein
VIAFSGWSDWFAWHPVITIDHRPIWLRGVQRRRVKGYSRFDGEFFEWEYRIDYAPP